MPLDLLATLRNASVEIVEVPGWRTRERAGTFTPVGQMDHHTAAKATEARPHPSLDICVRGRDNIPGPLCNLLIDWFGRVLVISDGRANDSGMGSSRVLAEVRRGYGPPGTAKSRGLVDDTNGNPWFWDIEVEYDGVTSGPNARQMETLLRVNVALYLAGAGIAIDHKEWTARKIDLGHVSMGDVRREISRRVDALAAATAGTGPNVAAEPKPVTSTAIAVRHITIDGRSYMRQKVPVRTDKDGNGYTGPSEGLHVPIDKVAAVTSHAPAWPPRDQRYGKVAKAAYHEIDGQVAVFVEGGEPNATVFPILLTAD